MRNVWQKIAFQEQLSQKADNFFRLACIYTKYQSKTAIENSADPIQTVPKEPKSFSETDLVKSKDLGKCDNERVSSKNESCVQNL